MFDFEGLFVDFVTLLVSFFFDAVLSPITGIGDTVVEAITDPFVS